MKECVNHPGREALSICHSCGESFCEECLTEGNEYYYCAKPECQAMLKGELRKDIPDTSVCPNCGAELELSEEEKKAGKIHCPECEALVDFNSDPPKVLNADNYVQLLSSLNQGDIGIIKSILDDAGIDYYVFGENFLSTEPLLQPARFFVSEDQLEDAHEVLKGFDLKIFGASKNDYEE